MITTPTGAFDYEEYDQLAHVVEGELISKLNDSLSFRVTEVWTGSSSPGDELTLYKRFIVNLEQGDKALFLVDSAATLKCYGLVRDGFYILVGSTSPNILTGDNLDRLSRGEEPEFNTHESRITVHFPLSSEVIDIRVVTSENGRRTISSYLPWNNLEPFGWICRGRNYMTELDMLPNGDNFYQGVQLGSFAGDVLKYSNGIFYINVWPRYPCFSSIQTIDDFYEHGTLPVYVFRIEMSDPILDVMDLPDEAYIVTMGQDFYLTSKLGYIENEIRYRYSFPLAINDILFSTAFPRYTGSRNNGEWIFLRFDESDRWMNRPLLVSILEAVDGGQIFGDLYFFTTNDSEPEPLTAFTMTIYHPQFEMDISDSTALATGMNDPVLSFSETGFANLEYGGTTHSEIHHSLELLSTEFRLHKYAAFRMPHDEDSYLVLLFTDTLRRTQNLTANRTLVAQLIEACIRDGHTQCKLFKYIRLDSCLNIVEDFTLIMR